MARESPMQEEASSTSLPSAMLQQILRDMHVDPDILAELDEQQKQTLFCKMRQEQVRRWKLWNDDAQQLQIDSPEKNKTPKKGKKFVSFLAGIDGEPWVWVMGEHEHDRSIEEILKAEAIEKARKLAEREAEQLRRKVEAQLSEYIDLNGPKIDDDSSNNKMYNEDIYCSVDELRAKINAKQANNLNNNNNNNSNKKSLIGQPFESKDYKPVGQNDVLHEIALNAHNQQKVAQRVALWERKVTEARTCEIFHKIRKKQQEDAQEAEEADRKQEQHWREQERKAKEAEQQIREIARKAREAHRLTNFEIETSYGAVNAGVPPGRKAVLDWYKSAEKPRNAGLNSFPVDQDKNDEYQPWFHGLITRSEAEKLLLDQECGSFLVRLSEKIWGYAVSYRAKDKCKHYLISASDKYHFLGNNQVEHDTLGDLIEYHKCHPLTGGEKLLSACPRTSSLNELA